MVELVVSPDRETLKKSHLVRKVDDPATGSGGMLTITKERIGQINDQAEVYLFGQEVNPETYAMCKADLFMKSPDGRDAESIAFGSTLANDKHAGERFDYMLTNPPYGKEWKMDQAKVEAEAEKGFAGRFGAGLPRISDGQLLFLQHMLGRMVEAKEGGSRIGIVMNGSPLFTGDAGSGESEIRRWILDASRDWLEAIVALPEQLFYNTGIATYIWVLTNRKAKARRGKVQLIDATDLWTPMRKSLGNKRREIAADHIKQIVEIHEAFAEGERSKIFPTTAFGYRKITVERPLRLNFQASPERIARLKDERAFAALAESKKKNAKERTAEEVKGRAKQKEVLAIVYKLAEITGGDVYNDRGNFERALDVVLMTAAKPSGIYKLPPPLRKAILSALSERDETAAICRDADGNPEADPELRDTENVPLGEDVQAFFDREVKPHVPDAWINADIRDPKDKEVGKVGYEINFNRYFYEYQPPRDLEVIEAEIKTLEKEIMEMLKEVTE